MDNTAMSYEECSEKLGHCWNEGLSYFDQDTGLKQVCRHCGASRQRAPEWQVPEPPPTRTKEER